jgi:hypothetical protein
MSSELMIDIAQTVFANQAAAVQLTLTGLLLCRDLIMSAWNKSRVKNQNTKLILLFTCVVRPELVLISEQEGEDAFHLPA